MVRVITKEELKLNPILLEELKKGVFIYPTDTIYGIGCDATNEHLVQRVREIKNRHEQPFSVIIPNKNMIFENCNAEEPSREWIDKLPGPYTLIFSVKKHFLARNVNPNNHTAGIRIPNHWFTEFVKQMKVPVVTTSVNRSGEDFMTSLDDLNPEIRKSVDFIIEDGALKGKPSTVVHLEQESVEIKER